MLNEYIAFNRISGAPLGKIKVSGPAPEGNDHVVHRLVDFNTETHMWKGTYKDGGPVRIDEEPSVVFEAAIDNKARDKILGKFSIYHQVSLMSRVVDALLVGNEDKVPEKTLELYNEMRGFIEETLIINHRYKESYANSDVHEYISKAQADEEFAAQLEGGLHEVLGPRETSDGS